jgi:hypothetical protein
MIEGSVDRVTVDGAAGWLGKRSGGDPIEVVASLNGQVVGEAVAFLPRPDLASAGFNGGRCGFEMAFSARLAERNLVFVSFRPKGSQLLLPRTSPDCYFDAFDAIAADFPAAGRHRSALGGLWTDRTDALQIVVGRARAGLCDPATTAALRKLVADGFVELKAGAEREPPALPPEAFGPTNSDEAALKATSAALAAYAFPPATVTLLKAVFDDAPVFYRPRQVEEGAPFAQAAAFEAMSSPAEMALAYVALAGKGARLDYVVDSHELPEFSVNGASRWSPQGAAEAAARLETLKRPVQSCDLAPGSVVLVGPGLIHRAICPAGAHVLRVVLSPQRVTPLRYLGGEGAWSEIALERGLRGRI